MASLGIGYGILSAAADLHVSDKKKHLQVFQADQLGNRSRWFENPSRETESPCSVYFSFFDPLFML
jgi:hypothetical protein